MPDTYVRITNEEREEISRGLAQGQSQAAIARALKRAPSSISRELQRVRYRSEYRAQRCAQSAWQKASSRRKDKRLLDRHPLLLAYVLAKLRLYWSPDQIAKTLRNDYPEDHAMRIAPETIYKYIYILPRGSLKKELIRALRHEHKYRRKRKTQTTQETRGKLADMLSIEERPKEVADRVVPGHWEGDLILGKHKQSALGTLVERTTRLTLLVPLQAKDATSVRKAYAKAISTVPKELRKTLTYDQGKEMSEHKAFSLATGMQVFFAHPASPWERGTNENTNGLIRQYFPKGTDFRSISLKEVQEVQRQLNDRPRRSLGYKTPTEAFTKLLR